MHKCHTGPNQAVWCMFQHSCLFIGQKSQYQECCVEKCIIMENPLFWQNLWYCSDEFTAQNTIILEGHMTGGLVKNLLEFLFFGHNGKCFVTDHYFSGSGSSNTVILLKDLCRFMFMSVEKISLTVSHVSSCSVLLSSEQLSEDQIVVF